MTELTRRELLAGAAIYGGTAVVALHWPGAARAAKESTAPLVLSPQEWETVEAVAARIVPSEDGSPGATEASGVTFIHKALAHEDAATRPAYTEGLIGVDAVSRKAHGLRFHALDDALKDAVLEALQDGTAPGWPQSAGPSPEFFETLRVHTLSGFLADPKYGGNRDWVGWKHVGYPGPRHSHGGYTPAQMLGTARIRSVWSEDP
jgi:gluconate 2-dehydrogenase gamma chain